MSSKAIIVFCAQTLFIQVTFSQCLPGLAGPTYAPGLVPYEYGAPFAYDGLAPCEFTAPGLTFTATRGGGLFVTSSSPIPPTGISVASDIVYEGVLSVNGQLPFVGTTGMDGVLPSLGLGSINHACGNGRNAMAALSDFSTAASVVTTPTSYGLSAPAIAAPAIAYNNLAIPLAPEAAVVYDGPGNAIEFTPTSSGGLPVSSASAIPPTGIAVAAETAYEGALEVAGEMPFVGSVGVNGVVPTAGSGAVNHSCGNGINSMINDMAAYNPATIAPAAIAAGYMGPGFACGGRAI